MKKNKRFLRIISINSIGDILVIFFIWQLSKVDYDFDRLSQHEYYSSIMLTGLIGFFITIYSIYEAINYFINIDKKDMDKK